MNEFWKRVLSGSVYVAVVVGSLTWSPTSVFSVLVGILTFLAVKEFLLLTKSRTKTTYLSALAATVLTVLSWMLVNNNLLGAAWAAAAYVGVLIYVVVAEVFQPSDNPIVTWGKVMGSQLMIGLPFALMNMIAARNQWLMLAMFVIVWINDSGAYCVGSMMAKRKGGNHKMAPKVSPGKSWEGLVGGLVCAMITGGVFSIWVEQWSMYQWILMGLLIGISATLGDLTESQMKRTIGVKDSGRFMPGHGGVLDRFDSMLLVVPVVSIIILIM